MTGLSLLQRSAIVPGLIATQKGEPSEAPPFGDIAMQLFVEAVIF